VSAAGSLDHAKLAAELRKGTFNTIVGEVRFGPNGEWQKNRTLTIQFQGVQAGDVNQFKQPGKAVILHPNELKSGNLIEPYVKARGAAG
jgi:branched-chain amino acid transport system substrate-binding protein